jgi:hypothetical protein
MVDTEPEIKIKVLHVQWFQNYPDFCFCKI